MKRSGPKDNKIDLPFTEAVDRVLAYKPTKKKSASKRRRKKSGG